MKRVTTKDTGHGRPKHHAGQSNEKGTKCQVGRVIYRKKQAAEHHSPVGQAERCGRCRQWHPVIP